jgi:hypothetical protein
MSRHDQLGRHSKKFVCTECKMDRCYNCIDCARLLVFEDTSCECGRKDHTKWTAHSARVRLIRMTRITTKKQSPGSQDQSSTTPSSESEPVE